MPRKCYIKPNRTNPRYFQPCAVARVARNCVEDNEGMTDIIVLACTAKGLGFTRLCLTEKQIAEAKAYKKEVDAQAAKDKRKKQVTDTINNALDISGAGFIDPNKLPPITEEEAAKVTQSILERMLAGRRALLAAAAIAVAAALAELFKGGNAPPVDTKTDEGNHRCVLITEILPESMCNCKK